VGDTVRAGDVLILIAAAPWYLLPAAGGVVVGLLAGPLGNRLGRPGAERQDQAARNAAAPYLDPGETAQARAIADALA
jgi:hypothetical protein